MKIQTALLCTFGSLFMSSGCAIAVTDAENVQLRKYVEGRTALSCAEFRRALQLNPREYEARVHLANIYICTGHFNEAQIEANTLVKEVPDLAVGHHLQAILKMHDDKYAEALAILEMLPSLKDADLPVIAGDKLICLAGLKRFKEADIVLAKTPNRRALHWWAIYSFANKMAGEGNNEGALYLAKRSPETDEPARVYLQVYTLANLSRVS